jgi:hypothetical protein
MHRVETRALAALAWTCGAGEQGKTGEIEPTEFSAV